MLLWYLERIYIENGLHKPSQLSLDGTPIDIFPVQDALLRAGDVGKTISRPGLRSIPRPGSCAERSALSLAGPVISQA